LDIPYRGGFEAYPPLPPLLSLSKTPCPHFTSCLNNPLWICASLCEVIARYVFLTLAMGIVGVRHFGGLVCWREKGTRGGRAAIPKPLTNPYPNPYFHQPQTPIFTNTQTPKDRYPHHLPNHHHTTHIALFATLLHIFLPL